MKLLAITGGAQGIGRATAQHFARAGYAVSFCDLDDMAGAEELADLTALKVPALFERTDVGSEDDVRRWVERTMRELGTPDVLINNAGLSESGDFLTLPAAQFDRVLSANLRSVFLCSQAFAQHMVDGTPRAIINIASIRAFMTEPGWEAYSASKGGILGMTRAMVLSLGPHRIRVNAISPGWIEVGDWRRSDKAEDPHHSERDDQQHPVGRVGRPSDIAEACQFLAEHAGFMTGQNLVLDGGMSVKAIYE